MFDLTREVAAWSEAVHAGRCHSAARVAELTDHLHCEIDRARAEGASDEQAFAAAVRKVGTARELNLEHEKNRSLFGRACSALARYDRADAIPGRRGPLLAHAILWASFMIATSFLLSKSATRDSISYLLIFGFVPVWWCSDQLLRQALRGGPKGGAK